MPIRDKIRDRMPFVLKIPVISILFHLTLHFYSGTCKNCKC